LAKISGAIESFRNSRPLDLSAFTRRGQRAEVWTLADRDHAGEPDVRNSFGDPERISARHSTSRASQNRFEYRFPALSLTVLLWRIWRI